jgi:hypothetical protein
MQIFTDDQGQAWTLAITVGSLKRLKALLPEMDLLNMDPALAARLSVDPILLCDVLYALVKPQADALGISDAQFGERLGLSLGKAISAFWLDLTDFFQGLDRQDQARVLTTLQEILRGVIERNAAAIEQYQESSSSTGSPASLASTPTRSP